MTRISDAAALLTALSAPTRLTMLATVAGYEARNEVCSLSAVTADLGIPLASVMKDAVRLQECGLLAIRDRTMSVDLSVLRDTAASLVAELPVMGLLADEPDLARFFKHGRLVAIPENPATAARIGRLLVQLLPTDRRLSESEVNGLLSQVHDDHASLRRLLVDLGLVARNASSDYRRLA